MSDLTFDELQNRLCELAPALTVRSLEPEERTIVVVHSLGVALHMVSAIAVAGRIGLTAIGDSPAEADELYQRVKSIFDAETRS